MRFFLKLYISYRFSFFYLTSLHRSFLLFDKNIGFPKTTGCPRTFSLLKTLSNVIERYFGFRYIIIIQAINQYTSSVYTRIKCINQIYSRNLLPSTVFTFYNVQHVFPLTIFPSFCNFGTILYRIFAFYDGRWSLVVSSGRGGGNLRRRTTFSGVDQDTMIPGRGWREGKIKFVFQKFDWHTLSTFSGFTGFRRERLRDRPDKLDRSIPPFFISQDRNNNRYVAMSAGQSPVGGQVLLLRFRHVHNPVEGRRDRGAGRVSALRQPRRPAQRT